MEFSESDLALIGAGFLLMETQKNVPTSEDFLTLYEEFETHIEATREKQAS